MIYWGISCIVEFLSYCLCYRAFFRVEFRKWKWILGGTIGTCILAEILIGLHLIGLESVAISISAIPAIMLITKKEKVRIFFLIPIVLFLEGLVNILGGYLISFVFRVPYIQYSNSKFWGIVTGIFTLAIFGIVTIITMRSPKEMVKFRVWEYILMLLGVGCLFLIVAITQSLMKGESDLFFRLKGPFTISAIIIGMIYMGLIIWQQFLEKKAIQYKAEKELYQQFLEKQENHIKDIVDADQKVRSFRHDIKAHIRALESGIEEGNIEFLKEYMERMKEETKKYTIRSFSGVVAVDAIVSEWYQKAVENHITWEWEGRLPEKTTTEVYDLCVLFSNLLSNAVEAVLKVEEEKGRIIKVQIGCMQEQIVIRVMNTCTEEAKENVKLKTTKLDSLNHGFGMKNIMSIIEKANGQIDRKFEDEFFVVEIVL